MNTILRLLISANVLLFDVLALVRLIRDTVGEANGVELRPEIRFLGQFGES